MKNLKNLALTAAVAVMTSPLAAFAADPTEGVTLLTETQTSNITTYIAGCGVVISGVMIAWLVVHLGVSGFKALRGAVRG